MPDLRIAIANPNLEFVTLEQAGRAILLAFFCDIPIALWGGPGIGKSSKVWQIAARVAWRLYDLRLSDKEKSDIGGIPMPVTYNLTVADPVTGEVTTHESKSLEYLMARELLPFDTDVECILFIDEVDRTDDPAVKNAIQPVILDRISNGHKLSPNCRIVLAGNGTSDIDTSELSRAANGRMIHLYIENESMAALDSWQEWAADLEPIDIADPDAGMQSRASDALRAFAKTNHAVFINGQATDQTKLKEQAEPTNRTWIYADKLIRASEQISMYKTSDLIQPLVAGCVGKGAATEFLAFRRDFADMPQMEQVLADPENAMVPERLDVFYALTFSLTAQATRDRSTGEAVAIYGLRWPDEPAAFLFRRLLEKQPLIATTNAYMRWVHKRRGKGEADMYPPYTHYEDELLKLFPNSIPRPENDKWINRIEIPVKSSPGKGFILSQNREAGYWTCACPGWTLKKPGQPRSCEHVKRLPNFINTVPVPADI